MIVLIAGDFCPQNRVKDCFERKDFASVLNEARTIIYSVDYSIVNYECPVTKGGEKPIEKSGPNLQCSEKGVEAIKWAGFNCVTLANNHFYDFGEEGVRNTLEACEKLEIDTVGGGMNLHDSSQIHYKEIEGQTLAIINCCEHEFSIATDRKAGSNPLNPIQQYYAIQEARTKADYVLVIVHGGHELWQLPSPRMVETYRFFVDAGADAVVNHHQHCFSGYEIYNGKPIFYGLGNFCFDKPNYFSGLWEYGYMVKIHFSNQITFEIIPYEQCNNKPLVELIKDKQKFEKRIRELNEVISNPVMLAKETELYFQRKLQSMHYAFEPYYGKVLRKLYAMGLLPNLMRKRKLFGLQNMVVCEAHRDKLIYYLKHSLI